MDSLSESFFAIGREKISYLAHCWSEFRWFHEQGKSRDLTRKLEEKDIFNDISKIKETDFIVFLFCQKKKDLLILKPVSRCLISCHN